ncbi:MAG: lysophospholipid acyltransferase family protein [Bacteroidota bacterium]
METTLRGIFGVIYTACAILIFILPMPLVFLFHVYARSLPEQKRLIRIYQAHHYWIKFWTSVVGLDFVLEGEEKIKSGESYMFVCNHVNMLDIPMVGSLLIHPWKSLAKKEIKYIPLLGWIITNISIVVDRSSPQSRSNSLLNMVEEIQRGISILVFPEGSRNRENVALNKFYHGAFKTAIQAQSPILPMVIYNTRNLQPVHEFRLNPGRGYLRILEPIPTEGKTLDDLKSLVELVHARMEAEILELDDAFRRGRGTDISLAT